MASLLKRSGTWFARVVIPRTRWADVGQALGSPSGLRREIVRTLETRDHGEAQRRLPAAETAILKHVDEALADKGFAALSGNWSPSWSLGQLMDRAVSIRRDFDDIRARGQSPAVDVAEELLAEHAEDITVPEWKRVVSVARGEAVLVGIALDRMLKERRGTMTQEMLDRFDLSVRLLGECLDTDAKLLTLDGVTRFQVARFRAWLTNEKGLKIPTAAARLGCLKTLWDWSFDAGLFDGLNPWAGARRGMKRTADKLSNPAVEVRPFTDAEVIKLLTTDPKNVRNADWRSALFDTLRIGLLTGMRQNEIASLIVDRVDLSREGMPGLVVTWDVSKTKNSIRSIPIHPLLQPVILKRIAALPHGETKLFPECIPGGVDNKPQHFLSKRFTTFRVAALGGDSPTTFHSTRRCFSTWVDTAHAKGAASCNELIRDHLMGHSPQSMAGKRYTAKELDWDIYCKAIEDMVSFGISAEVKQVLRETAGNTPKYPWV